jgi:hypothetical protein
MQSDRDEKQAHDPSAPAGEFRRGVKEPDVVDTGVIGGASLAGWIIAGAIGVVVGLLVALVPSFGIPWWGGVIIGFFVGITAGGFVLARLGIETVSDEAYGNIPKTRGGSRGFRPR